MKRVYPDAYYFGGIYALMFLEPEGFIVFELRGCSNNKSSDQLNLCTCKLFQNEVGWALTVRRPFIMLQYPNSNGVLLENLNIYIFILFLLFFPSTSVLPLCGSL